MSSVHIARVLLRAGENYHSPHGWARRDRFAEEVYREVLTEQRRSGELPRIDSVLRFLSHWNAARLRGGRERLRRVITPWVASQSAALTRLRRTQISRLAPQDFAMILWLAGSLWEQDIPATTYGKLLHILLPETVLLWDAKFVRGRYGLGDDPFSFVTYQSFGQRLVRACGATGRLRTMHSRVSGFDEPLTKLVDELAYSESLRAMLVRKMGGQAFSLASLLREASR